MLGATVRGFHVERLLTKGGTGRIFLARHTGNGDVVAIKVSANGANDERATLVREATLLAELAESSRTIVSWKDHDLDEELPWFAMEWVEGGSLSEYRAASGAHGPDHSPSGALFELDDSGALERALGILQQLAGALAVLHERGIVHADLTPKNVLLRSDGTPVLIDFGAAFRDGSVFEVRDTLRDTLHTYGTPGFVAPEVDSGFPGDVRRDLYSLGCVCWHVLTGASPRRNLAAEVERRMPATPLRDLLITLLQTDPEKRTVTSREAEAILSSLRGLPPSRGSRFSVSRARIVGRDEPIRHLHAVLDAARNGSGSATLLSGEAGIGKSRLLNEAMTLARRLGLRVVSFSCADIVPSPATSGRSAISSALVAAGLLPRSLRGQIQSSPEFERAAQLDVIFELLATSAARDPMVVLVDDLHWADDLTWAFAKSERLGKLIEQPVCLLASYRTKELHAHRLADLDARIWSVIELERLTVDHVRSIAQVMLAPTPLPSGFDQWLVEMTDGNPLHVTEFMREIAARKRAGTSVDALLGVDVGNEWVPQPLSEVMERRLASVSARARQCARVAALFGDEFAVDEIDGPLHHLWPDFDVLGALEELESVHVLEASAPARYRFSHNLYARCSRYPIPGLDEKELGRSLSQYYELHDASDGTARDQARLGGLLANAECFDKAFACFSGAARGERLANQVTRARTLYVQALEQFNALNDEQRCMNALAASEIHVELADLLHREARYDEADSHYQRALALVTDEIGGVQRASLLRKRARALRAPNRYEMAAELLATAKRELGAPNDASAFWSEWIEIEEARFWLTYYERKPFGTLLEELEPVVLAHGTNLQKSDFYQCACASLLAAKRYRGCEPSCRYAARALETIKMSAELRDRVPDAHMVAGFPLLWRERPQWLEAIELLGEAARGALWMDDLGLLAQARTYLALAHRRCGNVDTAESTARVAYIAADRSDSRGYRGASLTTLAWVAWKQGDLEKVDELASTARRWWRDGALRHPFQAFLNLVWADMLRTVERFDDARARLVELLAPDLQALPSELEAAIRNAATDGHGANARDIDRALFSVTQIALRAGYL